MADKIEPQEWRFDSRGYRSRIEKDSLVVRYEENGHGLRVSLSMRPVSLTRTTAAKIQVKDESGKDITDSVELLPSLLPSDRERWRDFLPYGRRVMRPVVQKVMERAITLTPEQIIAIMDHLISMSPTLKKEAFEKWGLEQPDTMDDEMPPESESGSLDESN
jgi:hypothetical protein